MEMLYVFLYLLLSEGFATNPHDFYISEEVPLMTDWSGIPVGFPVVEMFKYVFKRLLMVVLLSIWKVLQFGLV